MEGFHKTVVACLILLCIGFPIALAALGVCTIVLMPRDTLSVLPITNDPRMTLAETAPTDICLPVAVRPIPGEAEAVNDKHDVPRIFVAHSGQGTRWVTYGGKTRMLTTSARMVEIYEEGFTFDHCRWQGAAGVCIQFDFEAHNVEALTHGTLSKLRLKTRHEVFDDRLSRIAFELAQEALDGLPNGQIYSQGLSLSLLGLVAERYSVATPSVGKPLGGSLGLSAQRRVLAYIDGQLASDLSINDLAKEVQLSPFHFARLFKNTFGTTPHRFVQARRLAAATTMLKLQPNLPIAEVAVECGFASQAHLTHVMQRHVGATPAEVRRR